MRKRIKKYIEDYINGATEGQNNKSLKIHNKEINQSKSNNSALLRQRSGRVERKVNDSGASAMNIRVAREDVGRRREEYTHRRGGQVQGSA